MGRIQGVERQPYVDSFFLAAEESVSTEARNLERFVAVDQRAAVNPDSTATHHRQLVRPEPVPESVIRNGGNAGVELDPLQSPSAPGADRLGQLLSERCLLRALPLDKRRFVSLGAETDSVGV
jgi:hypothetical protein